MAKLCIYGAGKYGIEAYYQLKKMGIRTDVFSDRDKAKWGYALEGIFCIPPQELLQYDREETVLVIGVKSKMASIRDYFIEHGFSRVIGINEIIGCTNTEGNEKRQVAIRESSCLMALYRELCGMLYAQNEGKISDDAVQQIADDYKKRKRVNESIGSYAQ